MEIQRLFKLLKSLTGQTNIRDLIASFQTLLADNFNSVSFTVYELQSARIENQKKTYLTCLDCELKQKSFLLHKDRFLNQAYQELEPVFYTNDHHKHKAIYPVVLYDKSVSHLICISHEYNEEPARELLLGLLEIFTDIFRSIHEKGYDPLTRIFNRQAFDQTVSELAYTRHQKTKNKTNKIGNKFKAIAILDIDKFKNINDLYGHAIGDETLVLFAQTIRTVLRQEDLFFRYGGEEFVVLVKDVKLEQAQQVLERCRHAIETRRFPQAGRVTVSIGFADLDEHCHPIENLSKADKALYFIKKHGRNKAISYEELVKKGLLEPISIKESAIDFWD
jgi:diguanylate cyclase (GGDEF)-like protein